MIFMNNFVEEGKFEKVYEIFIKRKSFYRILEELSRKKNNLTKRIEVF